MPIDCAVIITAAGSSTRMGNTIKKEYLPLEDGTVLFYSVKAFIDAKICSHIIITIPVGDEESVYTALGSLIDDITIPFNLVHGGDSRQKSVYNGLISLENLGFSKEGIVLIHDGARPWLSQDIIQNVIYSTKTYGASAPGISPTDTLKQIDNTGKITQHLYRNNLSAVQTPQGFYFEKLLDAHKKASCDNLIYTDDTEIWGKYVGDVYICEGSAQNKKITYKGDI